MTRCTALAALSLITIAGISVGQGRLGVGRPMSREGLAGLNAPPDNGLRTLTITVDRRSNPLRKVTQKVSEELGIAVAYEEAPWASSLELMRAIDSPENILQFAPANLARWDPNWRAAAVGSVSVTADYQVGEEFAFARYVLLKALDDHARRGNPGQFRLEEVRGHGYGVVPANIRDEQGQWAPTSSPLDTRISFPVEERSLGATLRLMATLISDTTRLRFEAETILPGINSIFDVTTSKIGADNEVAREVLARAFEGVTVGNDQFPMWWNLEYFPDHNAYRLSFYPVHRTGPDGQWLPAIKPGEKRKP